MCVCVCVCVCDLQYTKYELLFEDQWTIEVKNIIKTCIYRLITYLSD